MHQCQCLTLLVHERIVQIVVQPGEMNMWTTAEKERMRKASIRNELNDLSRRLEKTRYYISVCQTGGAEKDLAEWKRLEAEYLSRIHELTKEIA